MYDILWVKVRASNCSVFIYVCDMYGGEDAMDESSTEEEEDEVVM